MIKKITLIVNMLLVAAVFSACASLSSTRTLKSAAADSQNPAAVTGSSISVSMLGPGTLKLEGTSLAVSPQQAKNLLFLWKAVKSLGSNTNTAQDEVAALYQQIEETMTAEQAQALQAMSLTNEDIQALMQQYGVQGGMQGSTTGQMSDNQRPNMGGFDGPPGGMMPGGDFQAPAGQTQRQTQMAGRSSGQSNLDLNALFADSIIKLLEQRVGN